VVEAEKEAVASRYDFVGIGTLDLTIPATDRASIIDVFPGSPAADAGLRIHDTILKVDGGPIREPVDLLIKS
jgi:S1-C subfamily serine protease